MHNMPVSARLLMRDAGPQAEIGGSARTSGAMAGAFAPRATGSAPETTLKEEAPMFLETAHTQLPIEFRGQVIQMEAHAYEDESASYQAMAVVHRPKGVVATTPVVRVH